jgi:hypothetical protein
MKQAISPYQIEYKMTMGNRVVGECTAHVFSEFLVIEKVKQELFWFCNIH